MPSLGERLKHGWNAFMDRSYVPRFYQESSYYRPDRIRLTRGSEKSIVAAIKNRIAIDVASATIQHVNLDSNGRYTSTRKSQLNNALSLEANIDQTARAFFHDVALSTLDEGCIAIVPVDTTTDPNRSGSFDIETLRVGKITQWYPRDVKVRVYNDRTGRHEEIIMSKNSVAIVENPFYAVMNEPNSILQRLIRKLNILDVIDEQSGSGKLDLLIQLPYTIKTETRRKQAEMRRKDIETQLAGSKYGIAYIDSTEHVTQLNRAVENNLLKQIEYLTNMVYSQVGITAEVLNGTADEQTMLNYHNGTVEPVLSAIVDPMKCKFLTPTARTQGQSIMFFKDPFKLVPINNIAEIADKFTRNEILSSNEIRGIIGFKPVDDPRADELRNSNLNQSTDAPDPVRVGDGEDQGNPSNEEKNQNGT